MSDSTAFPAIPVTAAEIIRQVGHGAYSRGQKYMRAGNVARYNYDDDARMLTGVVTGNDVTPYSTNITFPAVKTPGSLAFSARCTCPVRTDCKHAVALMLTAIDRADKARKALTSLSPTWRSTPTHDGDGAPQVPEEFKKRLEEFGVYAASQLENRAEDSAENLEDLALLNEEKLSKVPAWRRSLSHTLAARPEFGSDHARRASAALDLSFHVGTKFTLGNKSKIPQVSIQARPLMMGARGKWIKGGLSWENFQRDLSRSMSSHTLYPEHERWFAEFYSVVRPWQSAYTSHRDWVSLTAVNSSLLWRVLEKARAIGLPILLDGEEINFSLADATSVELLVEPLAEAGKTDDTGLSLNPVLRWGRYSIPAEHCHKLGEPRMGFVALGGRAQARYVQSAESAKWSITRKPALDLVEESLEETTPAEGSPARPEWMNEATNIVFIPLADPLDPVAESLAISGAIEVPARDKESFFAEYYPVLSRTVHLHTVNHSVELPPVRSPQLVLTVNFEEENSHTARTAWHWEYPTHPLATQDTDEDAIEILPALGYPGEDHQDIRDTKFEYRVLKEVKVIRPAVPFTRNTYEGWATRTLLEESLPRYREIDGVRIDFEGTVPEFKELGEQPEITVSVDSTGDRDWFGLGITIKMGEWYVPFAKVFEALNAGKTHLLLGDGSYFALDRPEFMKLQELLREASSLRDKETPLQISRHQVGMWEELEELAAETETVDAWDRQVGALLNVANSPAPELPAGLHAELRSYQVEGFQWLNFLWEHELGGILADDMGLGKTVQTIALFARAKEFWTHHQDRESTERFAPFLVVAPTSVVPNWEREIKKFAPELSVATIYESQNKSKKPLARTCADADVVVTSYALFRIDEEAYVDAGFQQLWNGLILDEAQFVKNAKTKAHRIARDIPARFKLAVTGTPMENNLMELWSMFSIVAPGLFPSARRFKDYYASPIEGGENKKALPRLRQRIRPLMKRRTKDLVAADLPEKNDVRVDVPLAPAHRRAYDTALQRERKKVLGLLEDMDKNRFTVFQSLTTMRRMALDASLIDQEQYGSVASSKLDYLEENLPEIVADGHRALIFSQFTTYLKKVAERLDSLGITYLYLDGSTRDRARVLEAFELGNAPIFLISLKAGGFGLNLTSADYCFIMDPWWNPAAEQQAVDRVHRIGQTRNVMVYRLVSAGTIEEKVMDLKDSKAALFDAVVDEGQFFSPSLTAEQVRDLLTSSEE